MLLSHCDQEQPTVRTYLAVGGVAGLKAGVEHGVFQPGVHNVNLLRAVDHHHALCIRQLAARLLLHEAHERGLAVFFPLLVLWWSWSLAQAHPYASPALTRRI
jgi:hypothetical protein